ncbi:MAG: hypothetical protein IKK51_00720 [Oscillospiraceae bacterium]|nr:hypothetical protein [Oscillospiraceae bacterium]
MVMVKKSIPPTVGEGNAQLVKKVLFRLNLPRTLNPLSCGVLFGYIMGVVGDEGATKINKISPVVRRKAHWLDGLF